MKEQYRNLTPLLAGVLAVIAVIMFAVHVFSDNKADVDLWGNVGFVRALPGSADYHVTNTFSFTEPDTPWVNHEWLAEYIMHRVYRAFGSAGLLVMKLVLGLGSLGLMVRALRRDCPNGPLRFLLTLLIISTMGYGFSTRPHHFTYFMVALLLTLLRSRPHDARTHLLAVPVMAAVWANLHGAFFIGAVILLVHAVAETVKLVPALRHRRQRTVPLVLFGGVILFVAAACINPYGVRLWGFIGDSGVRLRPYLSEWATFNPAEHLVTHMDFVVLVVLVCAAIPFSRTSKDATWTALLYLSLVAAILMRRNIPLFALVAGFSAGKHLDNAGGAAVRRLAGLVPAWGHAVLLAAFAGTSGFAAVTFNKTAPLEIEIPAERYPLQAVAFMKANELEGNAFVFFDWAEYCIWHLYPACRVYMDGRFRSAYSNEAIDRYLTCLYAQAGWREALEAYPTDMALVHIGNPVARKLESLPEWVAVYADGPAVLFLEQTVHRAFLERAARGEALPPDEVRPIFP